MRQLVILAGGRGARLKERLGDLPKPMIPIGGIPLLEHQIALARDHGFSEVIIFAGYRAEAITAHLGDGGRWGVKIIALIENEPLGTAGAVLAGFDVLADQFVVMYGDTMVNVDLARFWQTHQERGADASLFLHPNDHPLDSDLVEVNAEGWITAFHNRPHPPDRFFPNLVNAALYVVNKRALDPWRGERGPLDFGKDLFPRMLKRGAKLFGYRSPEYIKDIGTPERYDRVCAEYAAGVVLNSSFHRPHAAVFLDRDGTLNTEVDGVTSLEKLELIAGVAEAVRELNHRGARVVVVTNQPIVAKGWCTEADLQQIHNKLETLLGRGGAFVDRIYYCPHHPEAGFPGERVELKIACSCRKPGIGLIQRAAQDLAIDLKSSWLIGDSTRDIQTAKNAGIRSILVRTGYAGQDGKYNVQPDFEADCLSQAVELIVRKSGFKP
jgi:histidinol-phosphate phosphatase family protein